jgi:hypothetical protein
MRLASARAVRGRGAAHRWQRLELRASEEGAVVACFNCGRGWCGFGGEAAWLGRHSSDGVVVSRGGSTATTTQPRCAGGTEQQKGRSGPAASMLTRRGHRNWRKETPTRAQPRLSHPVLRPNQMLIVCMPRIKLSYIRSECKHRIPMSLL